MRVPSLNATTRELAQAVRELATGASNAHGSFSLAPGTTTTPVKDAFATPDCRVILTPTTADAAGAGAFVSAKGDGVFTVTHTSGTTNDRAFDYLILH